MDKIGKAMWLIFWCLALGLLVVVFQDKIDHKNNPNQLVTSHSTQDGRISVELKPNRLGHYVANGQINGQTVTLLLDTGATQISVPAHLAQQLQLQHGRQYSVYTANGTVNVSSTSIKTLSIGQITLYDLDANLNPGMTDNTILLGMNALKQLELTQRNNTLTLTK